MKGVVILFSIFYFLFSNAVAAEPQNLQERIESKLKELGVINQEIEKAQREIDAAQQQQKNLRKDLNVLTQTANQVSLGIKASEIQINKLNLELELLEKEINDTENEIAIKRDTLVRLLREIQQRDREHLLVAFLKNKSLAESFAEVQTIQDLNEQLSAEVTSLKLLQGALQEKFENQSGKKSKVELENLHLKNRRLILDQQKTERNLLLAQTHNQEKIYKQQLTELEKKQQEISDEIEKIEDELRKNFDPTILPIKRPGVFAWPLENPRITQKWGEVSHLYRGKPHNGLDLGAPVGTPVFAVADGEVMAVGDNGRYQYGKYVLIKHDNNLATLYAHLSRQAAVQGSRVKRGDLIGYVGNTGYSFGAHLHLGAYWAPSLRLENFPTCRCGLVPVGITIDPLDYL